MVLEVGASSTIEDVLDTSVEVDADGVGEGRDEEVLSLVDDGAAVDTAVAEETGVLDGAADEATIC